jgi:hypothetical protein
MAGFQVSTEVLALAWLQPVMELYAREGLREDVERINKTLTGNQEDLQKEFKTITAKLEISKDELERYANAVTDGGLDAALTNIAARFVARTADAKRTLEKMLEAAPLQSLFPIVKIRDGHVVAGVGSVQDDPDGRLITQLAENISIQTLFLIVAVDRMLERYRPSAKDIVDWLCRSPAFDGREQLIESGVRAFLDGDDIKAIHVLLPQVENGLRQLGGQLGIPVKKLVQHRSAMEDKNITDILNDDTFCAAVGEDTVWYFRALLNDPRGHNIRNQVLHGLMPAAYFSRQISIHVLHAMLWQGSVRIEHRR